MESNRWAFVVVDYKRPDLEVVDYIGPRIGVVDYIGVVDVSRGQGQPMGVRDVDSENFPRCIHDEKCFAGRKNQPVTSQNALTRRNKIRETAPDRVRSS
jgi:hypothetical protein